MTDIAPTIVLRGIPDGLEARPVYRWRTANTGERVAVRTRRGLLKFDRVELAASDSRRVSPILDERERRFILGAQRRSWRSLERRYNNDARGRCIELALAGIVQLRCTVTDDLELGDVIDWTLTPPWSGLRSEDLEARRANQAEIQRKALDTAESIDDLCPQLARVLREARPHTPALPALVAVADDLRDGVVSASPRAFSQRHFGSTKAHDGVARVLERLGVPPWVADATGVRRSSRIGVAGQVLVASPTSRFKAGAFAGPVTLRADQSDLRLEVGANASALILVENLQAAEAIADVRPDLAIIYTGGMPGRATLDRIMKLAAPTADVWIATDADLGGVRIAEQLLEVVPDARLIDVGTIPHEPQPTWPLESAYRRSLEQALVGRAGALAEAVLARGYSLEQELLLVEAIAAVMPRHDGSSLTHERGVS